MSPKKKRIKEMTAEEVAKLTDDEVMGTIFDKRVAKKLRKAVEEPKETVETKRNNSH